MPNMSYCRFSNTEGDLRDCIYAMEDAESFEGMELSTSEQESMHDMAARCQEFLDHYQRLEQQRDLAQQIRAAAGCAQPDC